MNMKKYLHFWGLLLCCAILGVSCNNEDDVIGTDPDDTENVTTPDFSKKVKNTVSGFVTNEYDDPVVGAIVTSGILTTTTNEYGYFEIKDATVTKNLGVVTVEAANYYKGIRTWVASADDESFVRIKLIRKEVEGSFEASAGGKVTLTQGLELSFPANGLVNEATGETYAGNVDVYAYWINPLGDDFEQEMPGDLSAIGTDGELRNLVSYGMVAAELRGQSNEKLQVAEGEKVKMVAPIEIDQLNAAPETMPLWLFDEEKGLWSERGEAKKEGNAYVGEFDHFSYWNLDIPFTSCNIHVIFFDELQKPMVNQRVTVSGTINNQKYQFSAYTNAQGKAKVRGVLNSQATILLSSVGGCSIIERPISLNSTTVDLGVIQASLHEIETREHQLAGSVVDCDGKPMKEGLIIYRHDGVSFSVPFTGGKYQFAVYNCLKDAYIDIIALDPKTSTNGSIRVDLTDKNPSIEPIEICGGDNLSYLKFVVKGKEYVIYTGIDNEYYSGFARWESYEREYYPAVVYFNDPVVGNVVRLDWLEKNSKPVKGEYALTSFYADIENDVARYVWYADDFDTKATVTMNRYLQTGENSFDVKGTFIIKGAVEIDTREFVDITGEFSYKGEAIPQ